MSTLTLTVKDIEILKKAQSKIYLRKRLSSDERVILCNFLESLPLPETILNEKLPIDERFEIKLFDIEQMWPQLDKWLALFNNLPKNGSKLSVHAGWISADDSEELVRKNIIISGAFVPSLQYSKKAKGENKIIGFNLKTDGTAEFQFWRVEDAGNFPELYKFTGSWKEAYLLVVKTLQEGWPQTQFPEELLPLLKK
jgi:hypothetical protein